MPRKDEDEEPTAIPITGELDLHSFRPEEVSDLLNEYLLECRRRGIQVVRIVHGKGTGALRATVHAALRRSPIVADFGVAGASSGGWGATFVTLKRTDSC